MRVVIGDAEYVVEFEIGVSPKEVKRTGFLALVLSSRKTVVQDITLCSIRDASGGHTTDRPPVIASGRVARYYRDSDRPLIGQKFALRAALNDLDRKQPVLPGDCLPPNSKGRRRLFWDAWLATSREHFRAAHEGTFQVGDLQCL